MADDAAGVLDALGIGIPVTHVVGASLGGMIAQTLAIRHPHRVLSLASLMSTTGRRGVGRTSWRVYRHMLGRRPRTEQAAVERRVRVFATVGSPVEAQDREECHPSGGEATADAIPGARLELIHGMKHDLPRWAWPRIAAAIVDNARRAKS